LSNQTILTDKLRLRKSAMHESVSPYPNLPFLCSKKA